MLVDLKRYKSVLDSMYLELFDSHIKVVSPHSKSTRVHLLQYCAKVFISTAAWKVWKWIISCFCHHRASFLTFFLFASDIFQRDYEQIKKSFPCIEFWYCAQRLTVESNRTGVNNFYNFTFFDMFGNFMFLFFVDQWRERDVSIINRLALGSFVNSIFVSSIRIRNDDWNEVK